MSDLTVTQARDDFAQTVERVHHTHERVCITKHGRRVAALVSIEDLDLLARLEDHFDIEAAREALAESDERIPFDAIRKELGLR